MIGLGFMRSTHLEALQNSGQAQLVAVASNGGRRLSGGLSGPGEKLDFSHLRKYRDAMDAVRGPEAEAVDICLPTSMHAPVASAAGVYAPGGSPPNLPAA